MNITQEKIDNLNSVVNIKISPEDYQARVEKAIKEQAKKAKLPGFRPGMVPPAHIKRMYGKSILVDEINSLLSDTLNNYVTENKLELLGQPLPKPDSKEFNWDFNDDFEFNYELGLSPEFELNFSAKDEVPHYKIKIDEETLAARIKNIRRSYGKMTNPDVSADGDVLFGEIVQLATDGSVFEDGFKNEKSSVRIDLVKDEAIKQSLVGLKKGDVVEFDIHKAFPEASVVARVLNVENEEEVQDLKSTFRLTVKNINRLDEADLDQEFFDKIFGKDNVKTEEEFRAKITEEQEGMMVQNAEQKLQNDLYDLAMQKVDFQLPDDFLRRWLKATNEKITPEELEEGYADFAKGLKWNLIENKIIKNNNIDIKYEEVFQAAKQKLDGQFRMYSPQPVAEEQLAQYTVQYLQNKENANRVFEEVKAQRVLEQLKTEVTLKEQEIEYNKFLEMK